VAGLSFTFAGAALRALPSGALFWAEAGLLCVSDLHFGKAQRGARTGGAPLPPYEVRETLGRLAADLALTGAARVVALGDSFDDGGAAARLAAEDRAALLALLEGRAWTWIAGNHDPAPVGLPGAAAAELRVGPIVFRHVAATARPMAAEGEISGHYHPKLRLPGGGGSHAAFLVDAARVVMPAYGTYAGGLSADAPVLAALLAPPARALLVPRAAGQEEVLVVPLGVPASRGRRR
jgi:DNA ligase-associated metallophosphoesterase